MTPSSYLQTDFAPVMYGFFDDEDINTSTKSMFPTGMSRPHIQEQNTVAVCSSPFSGHDVSEGKIDITMYQDETRKHGTKCPMRTSSRGFYLRSHEHSRDSLWLPSLPRSRKLTTTLDLAYQVAKKDVILPTNFIPAPYSVIIGRGKECKGAIGNQRLKILASTFLEKYSRAIKSAKSKIVSTILSMIREACPLGAFIRLGKDGNWYEVSESVAIEKIGYTMRELIGSQYKSSSKSRTHLRRSQANGNNKTSSSSTLQSFLLPNPNNCPELQPPSMGPERQKLCGVRDASTAP